MSNEQILISKRKKLVSVLLCNFLLYDPAQVTEPLGSVKWEDLCSTIGRSEYNRDPLCEVLGASVLGQQVLTTIK